MKDKVFSVNSTGTVYTQEKEIMSAPNRSRTYDLPISTSDATEVLIISTSDASEVRLIISTSDALPLSYRRLVLHCSY